MISILDDRFPLSTCYLFLIFFFLFSLISYAHESYTPPPKTTPQMHLLLFTIISFVCLETKSSYSHHIYILFLPFSFFFFA
ncbi:hypothetical protein J3Q64DRAFT_1752594 [Phycomyces blakesleeanus]|uniref:Uncharacterized protein n=1 Tax=Phycomyces blakesleeanus TaxID=4837 RepID=A0ABR3AU45_PHYBL